MCVRVCVGEAGKDREAVSNPETTCGDTRTAEPKPCSNDTNNDSSDSAEPNRSSPSPLVAGPPSPLAFDFDRGGRKLPESPLAVKRSCSGGGGSGSGGPSDSKVSSENNSPLLQAKSKTVDPLDRPIVSKTFSRQDSVPSPFLIPRNPFLFSNDRMPNFVWSTEHLKLLEDFLELLHSWLQKWESRYIGT